MASLGSMNVDVVGALDDFDGMKPGLAVDRTALVIRLLCICIDFAGDARSDTP